MDSKTAVDPTNQKSSFDSLFKTKLKEIKDMLTDVEKNSTETAEHFHVILQRISELQEFLNDSKTFLPAYNMKKCSNEIKDVTKHYEQMHEKILPKKKFAFGNRPKAAVKAKVEDKFEPINKSIIYKEDCGFKNRTNENLILSEDQTLSKDIALDMLSNCNVFICGLPSTVRVSLLSSCKIFACANTSIFVENCKDTIFMCASQQLRIHDTVATDFYIYVTSSAIIENCKQLRFAPLLLDSPLIKRSFEMANFNETNNNWKIINDFDWLSSYESSPNWSEIPEEERSQPVDEYNV